MSDEQINKYTCQWCGDSALEENYTFSEGGDSRVRGRYGVPNSTVSRGLSVMGILEPSCLFME